MKQTWKRRMTQAGGAGSSASGTEACKVQAGRRGAPQLHGLYRSLYRSPAPLTDCATWPWPLYRPVTPISGG